MDQDRPVVDVDINEVKAALARIKAVATGDDHALVERLVDNYIDLTRLVRERGTTIARLRRLFGLAKSEKTANVVGKSGAGRAPALGGSADRKPTGSGTEADTTAAGPVAAAPGAPTSAGEAGSPPAPGATDETAKKKSKGHGRLSWQDYPDALRIPVMHPNLRVGQICPLCGQGKLYDTKRPAPIVRIIGRSPLHAVCWLCQALRCSTCGHLFTAPAPEHATGPKHDETAVSMIIILRYGTGLPHHRLAKLQGNLRTPIPTSTLWDVVDGAAAVFRPVYGELRRQAAQSTLLYFDDSYVRILELMGKSRTKLEAAGKLSNPDRTGLFTTGIVAVTDRDRRIALFCSGRNHAGENMAELLSQREQGLSPPALMCDGLDRNVPKGHVVVEGNCMSHGRRHVCDEVQNFPVECAHILERIARVYRVDRLCRVHKLSNDDRLRVHQKWSGPVMDEILKWMTAQLDDKRVEPNSGMGKAMTYLIKRWDKLTLFLRRPGAPLDNNVCERLLKVAIQHRKNSLFFKTADGAKVGDLFMSLIATAVLNDVNALDYLTEVQRHAKAAAENPADWLPWTYRETLTSMAATETPAPRTYVPRATAPHQRPPPS